MAEKKMTKREWFEVLKGIVEASEYEKKEEAMEFITHEMELLKKKSSTSAQTKTQKENVEIMKKIKECLQAIGKPVTISEFQNESPEMSAYSNQKLSALLKQLVASGEVVRTEEKKKAYFSVA